MPDENDTPNFQTRLLIRSLTSRGYKVFTGESIDTLEEELQRIWATNALNTRAAVNRARKALSSGRVTPE